MNSSRQVRNIALIGFMGTGKSSVGRAVAEQLHFQFLDTDDLVETRTGKTISTIFEESGEPAFRQLEKDLVAELTSRSNTVISAGGGLGANEANLESLKQHALLVCLWASPEKIWERVRHQSHRPLLQEADPLVKIRQLLAARERVYKQADILLNTELRSLREVTQQVLHHYKQITRDNPR